MPKFMKITCKVKRIPIRELDLDHSVCIAATCSSDPISAILTFEQLLEEKQTCESFLIHISKA